MKRIQEGVVLRKVAEFSESEEVCVVGVVEGSQYESGKGFVVVSMQPPFITDTLDSSYVEVVETDIMTLGDSVYPIYKGLFIGQPKETSTLATLEKNTEVYVLATLESFIFKDGKGYLVAKKKDTAPNEFMFLRENYSYEPFVVESEELLFEFETFIPQLKEVMDTF